MRVSVPALAALCVAPLLLSCGGGDVVAIMSGSGDGTASFRLDRASNISYTYTVSNDGTSPCIAMKGVRMNARGWSGDGPTVNPSSSLTGTGGMHLAAGDWLMDFRTKTPDDTSTNLLTCHWRMVLATSDQNYPDIPKTGMPAPGDGDVPGRAVLRPGRSAPHPGVRLAVGRARAQALRALPGGAVGRGAGLLLRVARAAAQ